MLVITIIVILILAAAIIISLNNNNPIMEANKARYDSDVANMQAVFANAVAKVMAHNRATVSVTAGQINSIITGVKETTGEVSYTVTDAINVNNSNGKIVFGKGDNTDTVFYTGKQLPIYSAGDTKWYVDEEGNISLEVAGIKYGNGEFLKVETIEPKPATFGTAYAIYSEDDNSLTFMRSETKPVIGEKYKGKKITNVYDSVEDGDHYVDGGSVIHWGNVNHLVKTVTFDDVIQPLGVVNWFWNFVNCERIDLTNLDISKVTDMCSMFGRVGYNTDACTIIGLDKLNTSNVKRMEGLFDYMGQNAGSITLDGIEDMNVSNVENMRGMFSYFGASTPNISLDLTK